MPTQGVLTITLKVEVSVPLTSSYLLVRNRLHQEKLGIFFFFQNNLILTCKDQEVRSIDSSLFFKGESSLANAKLRFSFPVQAPVPPVPSRQPEGHREGDRVSLLRQSHRITEDAGDALPQRFAPVVHLLRKRFGI